MSQALVSDLGTPPAVKLRDVVVCDQFFGPTPYWLSQQREKGTPYRWTDFLAELDRWATPGWNPPTVQSVDEATFRTPWASTVLSSDERGHVIAWRMSWDSSG
jgi:hypothetical protein